MKNLYLLSLLVIILIFSSCSKESETEPEHSVKQYDVEYSVTISSGTIAAIKYLTETAETLSVADAASFSYKWKSKGKAGDHTYIMLRLTNTRAKAYIKILANTNPIVSDSLSGAGNGSTVEMERGMTLPY